MKPPNTGPPFDLQEEIEKLRRSLPLDGRTLEDLELLSPEEQYASLRMIRKFEEVFSERERATLH